MVGVDIREATDMEFMKLIKEKLSTPLNFALTRRDGAV